MVLRSQLPGATNLRQEQDEAHLFELDGGGALSQQATAANIAWNIPHDVVELKRYLSRTGDDIFREQDDYTGERISKKVDNTTHGGLTSGEAGAPIVQLLRKGKLSSFKAGVGGVSVWIEELLNDVSAEHFVSRYGLGYFDCVAVIQCYVYVTSLRIDPIAFDGLTKNFRGSRTWAFKQACYYKMAEFAKKETANKPSSIRRYLETFQPMVPAVWMYVYVCACYQRTGGIKPQGQPTMYDVMEYLPYCVKRSNVQGSGTTAWRGNNSMFECRVSTSGKAATLSDILNFTLFSEQQDAMVGKQVIVPSSVMTGKRERLTNVQLVLPAYIGDNQDLVANLGSYIDAGSHFTNRMQSYGLESYVTHMMNYWLTQRSLGHMGVVKGGGKGQYLIERDASFRVGNSSLSVEGDASWDSLKGGSAGMSGMVFNGGIVGICNLRFKLRCTAVPDIWKTVADDGFVYETGRGMLETQVNDVLKRTFDSSSVRSTIANNGAITVYLGYDRAYLKYNETECRYQIVVDGDVVPAHAKEARRRCESFSYRKFGSGRAEGIDHNVYAKEAQPQPFGITCEGNVMPTADSALLRTYSGMLKRSAGLLMTIPAGNIRNLLNLWKESGSDSQTFEEWVATAPQSVAYKQQLPEEVQRLFKLIMPVTHQSTGLCEAINFANERKVCAFNSSTGERIPVDLGGELMAADGALYSYERIGILKSDLSEKANDENNRPLRAEVCSSTSGFTMSIVTALLDFMDTSGEGKILADDLVNLQYTLWALEGSKDKGGLQELIGGNATNELFTRQYLEEFYKCQFVQMVARQGYNRQTYGYEARDAIMIRLVISTFLTLQTADVRLDRELNPQDFVPTSLGPIPSRAITEPSRRNMRAVLLKPGQVPSFQPGIGALTIFIATALDMSTILRFDGDGSPKAMFRDVQLLQPKSVAKADGVIKDEVQRAQTFVNAATHYRVLTTKGPKSYKGNPYFGREIGRVYNPSFGSSGLEAVRHASEVTSYDESRGLAGDHLMKTNEVGELIGGIDTLGRQMFSVIDVFELNNPNMRGQIYMVSTGMFFLYAALIWSYPKDPSKAEILGRRLYMDPSVRFASKMMKGKDHLHDLNFSGLSRQVADAAATGEVLAPIGLGNIGT